MNIPFLHPTINEEDIENAARALRSGWITGGKATEEFEEKFGNYLGTGHTVVNSSGTAALHIALMAAGIGPGDEVITTPISYVATSNVILYVGATPVFVDVEPETGLIDASKVEEAITEKTKAIIPVHLYGQMADMKKLSEIAEKNNLIIIEDAPHAIEAERDGIRPGEKSFAACWSFHAAKNITAGEGGAVTVNDKDIAEKVKLLTESGVEKSGGVRRMVMLGYKYSFTNFQSALLLGQLKRIDDMWEKRRGIFEIYSGVCDELGVKRPKKVPNSKHGHHMFVIWVDPSQRDRIRKDLSEEGIGTAIHYDPIHLEPYYKGLGFKEGQFPNAEKLGFGSITLPLYPALTEEQVEHVVESLKKISWE